MSNNTRGYGTTARGSAPEEEEVHGARAGEQMPLLRKPASHSMLARFRSSMTVDVQRERADIILVLCYLVTGLLDSASISIWGSFVSMQTGNTVYIGLGLAAPHESTRWIKSSVSLGCFCLGSFLFSRFHRYFSPKRRWVLCASFLSQMALTIIAAAIVTFGPSVGKEEISWNVLLPIALVAFQSCGQAVTSRALKYNSLTSVVLTSIYCDLFSDPDLFKLDNPERNRRLGAPVMLLVGAVLGGLFAHSSFGIAGALWTAAVFKLLAIITWLVWPAESEA
ncbi:hypothetical protein GE09DRAFT_1171362 [Coniochaeta sp. 2T2.1]|nr:hypothetical protein GE09DRAFT_1171362 [Coniochaeta sp. 2T2.1]